MSIATELQRTAPILKATPTPTADKRTVLADAAATLSRRGVAGARAEVANASLERVLLLAYEQDDGGYCNLDPLTHRLLFGLPWGRKGCRVWGVRPSEARVLSAILLARPNWLFSYDAPSRSWTLNLRHYPSLGRAMQALQGAPILAAEWQTVASRLTTAWARGSERLAGK